MDINFASLLNPLYLLHKRVQGHRAPLSTLYQVQGCKSFAVRWKSTFYLGIHFLFGPPHFLKKNLAFFFSFFFFLASH